LEKNTMKLGLHIPSTSWAGGADGLGSKLAEIVEAAESAGFETIDVADHLWQHPAMGGPEASQIEAYTTLGFIAAHTRRVRLLALATAVSYRHAGLLAKMVTTLDVLSGGRAMLGIGAGDYPEEAQALACRFRPSASGSICSKRQSRPACACGRARVVDNRSSGRTYESSAR
jgi:alkanesulfonate monooxygenase SsuD/methylene tetrahydromethanopterin reductase-like flavin-dependent oxidoreductase (luciferase family)